MSVEKTTFCK